MADKRKWYLNTTSEGYVLLWRIFLALWLILTVVYSQFTSFVGELGGYADKRIATLLSASLFSLLWVVWLRKPVWWGAAGWLVFSGAAVMSESLGQLNTPYSWLEVVFFSLILLAISGLAQCYIRFPVARLDAVKILLAGMMSYALMTPAVYLFALMDGVTDLSHYIPWGFVNIRYWNHLASWLLPLLPLASFVSPLRENTLWRMGGFLTAGIWWWMLLMTAGRGSVLGIIVGVVMVLIFCRQYASAWIKVLALQFALGVIFWIILSNVLPALFIENPEYRNFVHERSISTRVLLLREAWQMSLQAFPLGLGGQSWITHEPILNAYLESNRLGHPHNMYMMWAAEYGWLSIVGLTIILVGAVVCLLKLIKLYRLQKVETDKWAMVCALTASVTAAFIHAGVSAVFLAPASMLVGMPILALFWSMIDGSRIRWKYRAYRRAPLMLRVPAFGALLVVLAIWWWGIFNYYHAMRLDQQVYAEQVGEQILPRFWFHGYFPRPGSE